MPWPYKRCSKRPWIKAGAWSAPDLGVLLAGCADAYAQNGPPEALENTAMALPQTPSE